MVMGDRPYPWLGAPQDGTQWGDGSQFDGPVIVEEDT